MKKLTEQMLESAFDPRTGEISEESLDALKLTDEELEEITGSQFGGGFGGGGFGASTTSATSFQHTQFGGSSFGGGFGAAPFF